jgi:hypothetical protein
MTQDLKSHLWECAEILRGSAVDRTDWKPGTRQMEMRGRPMDGYIYVDPPVGPDAVRGWVDMATAFVRTLPPKTKAKRGPTKQKRK